MSIPGDGMTPDTAVRVGSVREQYEWARARVPGYRLLRQCLERHAAGMRDTFMLRSPAGDEVTIYFDISSFYGIDKKDRPTAPCPYCGKPLRTAKAKQCRHCGQRWDDR